MTGLSWEDDGAGEGLMTRRCVQQCLSDKEIEDFLFDRLSGVTREVIEEHLLACHKCLDRVEEEERYVATVRKAADRIQREEFEQAVEGKHPAAGKRLKWLGKLFGNGPVVWATVGVTGILVTAILVQRQPEAKTEVEVALRSERGAAPEQLPAAAGRELTLTAEIKELPEAPVYRLDVVDAAGRLMASADIAPETGRLRWKLPRALAAGVYWVRLRNPEQPQGMLREYGLVVR